MYATSRRKNQRGVVLLVVLCLLLIISLIGINSVLYSNVDSKTTEQIHVHTLLFQSSDLGLFQFEREANKGHMTDADNIFGYLRLFPNDYVTFCLKPTASKIFASDRITHLTGQGYKTDLNNGYCNPHNHADFVSGRQTSMVQMTVNKKSKTDTTEAFNRHVKNTYITDIEDNQQTEIYQMHTIAVIPSYTDTRLGSHSDTSTDTLTGCLKQSVHKQKLETCFQKNGIPYHSQTQEYGLVATAFESITPIQYMTKANTH